MSVKVMGLVWESGLPKNQKMCLLAYADHANDDGTSVYPGEQIMAEKTSDSAGNVRRVTKLLIEDGVLVQTKRGYRGQRAEFRIDLERLAAHIAHHSVEIAARDDQESRAESGGRRAPRSRKARGGATPNHHEPSEPSQNHQLRAVDHLWDSFTEIHGQPASKTERGKYNKAVKLLREADVQPDEYAGLVAAYAQKYDQLQPSVMTVATRIGEMRHYRDRGAIKVPTREEADFARRVAALEAKYGDDGMERIDV